MRASVRPLVVRGLLFASLALTACNPPSFEYHFELLQELPTTTWSELELGISFHNTCDQEAVLDAEEVAAEPIAFTLGGPYAHFRDGTWQVGAELTEDWPIAVELRPDGNESCGEGSEVGAVVVPRGTRVVEAIDYFHDRPEEDSTLARWEPFGDGNTLLEDIREDGNISLLFCFEPPEGAHGVGGQLVLQNVVEFRLTGRGHHCGSF